MVGVGVGDVDVDDGRSGVYCAGVDVFSVKSQISPCVPKVHLCREREMLKIKPKPHYQFRERQSRFRKKCRSIEGQNPDLWRENENVAKSIGQDAKRNDLVPASVHYKNFLISKETASHLHESKAQLSLISSQHGESTVTGRTDPKSKNSKLIQLVNNLMKAPEVAAAVDCSSKQHVRDRFTNMVMHSSKLDASSNIEHVNHSQQAAYNRLMKAFSRVGKVSEVLRLFSEMKEKCIPNVLCFNTVLNCLVTTRSFNEALKVLLEMLYCEIDPNVSTYNIIVKLCCCYYDQPEIASQILESMSERGYRPDVTTYSTLITGLCRFGRVDDAYIVLDKMLNEKCYPNLFTYTPVLKGLCAQGKITEAKGLMEFMRNSGCPPNPVAYNILIDALCKLGNFDEVDSILEESESNGWKPNAISHCIYINGLCRAGKIEEAFRQLEANNFLDPSVGLDWDANFLSYYTVMNSFCKIGRCSTVLKLFTDMLKKGIAADTRTYNIVVHSLCKAGKLRKAKCMVLSKGFSVNVVTYNTLINGYCRIGDLAEVEYLYRRMTTVEKICPDKFTYTSLIVMYCREGKTSDANRLFDESLKKEKEESLGKGLWPDLVVYSAMINGHFRNGLLCEGLELLDIMLGQGLVPNAAIYDSVLRAYCRGGFCLKNISHVWITIDKMLGKISA